MKTDLTVIQDGTDRPVLFVMPAIGGHPHYVWSLSKALGPDQPVTALSRVMSGEDHVADMETIGEALARAILGSGVPAPYFLLGYSFGAQCAVATAEVLERMGAEVCFLGVLDDDAELYRRRFGVAQRSADLRNPVPSGRLALDRNPLSFYSGTITLFRADHRTTDLAPGAASDWDFRASGGVDVFPVPCIHADIVLPAIIARIAPDLRAAMDRVLGLPAKGGREAVHHPSRRGDFPDAALAAYRLSKAGDLQGEIDGYLAAVQSLEEAPDWMMINLSAALQQAGDTERALQLLTDATGRARKIGNRHLELIKILMSRGARPKAQALVRSWQNLTADTATDWQIRGVVAQQAGMPRLAEQAFRRALDLDPARPDCRNRWSRILIADSRFDEATELLQEGLRQDPESLFLRAMLGEVLLAAGKPDEAIEALHAVLAKDDTQWRAITLLAEALRKHGRIDEGKEVISAAIDRHPVHHGLWLARAELCEAENDPAQAEAAYRRSIELNDMDQRPWLQLSQLLDRTARTEEALSLLRSAPGPLRQTPPFRLLAGELALR